MSVRTVLLVLVVLPLAACPPPCRSVCRKVLFECGDLDSERVSLEECEVSCQQQEILFAEWENGELGDLFDDHKRCVNRSSCEEIADGVCYEGFEELFTFDPDKVLPPIPEDTAATSR